MRSSMSLLPRVNKQIDHAEARNAVNGAACRAAD